MNKSEETLKKLKSILEMIRIFFVLVKNGECYCYENIWGSALEPTILWFGWRRASTFKVVFECFATACRSRDPIIYLFDGNSLTKIYRAFILFVDVLMEQFLEGIDPLRNQFINLKEKKCYKYYTSFKEMLH